MNEYGIRTGGGVVTLMTPPHRAWSRSGFLPAAADPQGSDSGSLWSAQTGGGDRDRRWMEKDIVNWTPAMGKEPDPAGGGAGSSCSPAPSELGLQIKNTGTGRSGPEEFFTINLS